MVVFYNYERVQSRNYLRHGSYEAHADKIIIFACLGFKLYSSSDILKLLSSHGRFYCTNLILINFSPTLVYSD